MKTAKKILSVILSVLFVSAVFGVCASAEGTANGDESVEYIVTTEQEDYAPGDDITVSVSLKTNYNMTTFRFPIMFDSAVFELPNLINLTALNTCKEKGTLGYNSQDVEKFIPTEYSSSDFGGVLVQWTASVSNSTLGCLNLPNGEVCFTFTLRAKTSAAGKSGTIFIPSEYTGFYDQAIQTPTDATTIYNLKDGGLTSSFEHASANVNIVGETADLVPNEAYDSQAVVNKDKMLVYGFDVGMTSRAEITQKVKASGAGSLKITSAEYGMGTGTVIDVIVDDSVVKSYKIVVFGDVNGDALIDTNDTLEGRAVSLSLKMFDDSAVRFAADVTGDSIIDSFDVSKIQAVALSLGTLDQVNPY